MTAMGQSGTSTEQPFSKAKRRWLVDRGDDFVVIRFPWWIPVSVRNRVVQDALSDARVKYPRQIFEASVGSRLVRFTWESR